MEYYHSMPILYPIQIVFHGIAEFNFVFMPDASKLLFSHDYQPSK
jgi:hypothetical protein